MQGVAQQLDLNRHQAEEKRSYHQDEAALEIVSQGIEAGFG